MMALSGLSIQDKNTVSQSLYVKARPGRLKKGVLASLIFHLFIGFVVFVMGDFLFPKPAPDSKPKAFMVSLITEKPAALKPEPVKPKPVKPKSLKQVQKKKPLDLTLPKPKPLVPKSAPKPAPKPLAPKPAPKPKKQMVKKKTQVSKLKKAQKQLPPLVVKPPKPVRVPPPPRLTGTQIVKQYSSDSKPRGHSKPRGTGKKGSAKPVLHNKGTFKLQDGGAGSGSKRARAKRGAREDTLKQSERDFLLAQILKYWRYNYNMPAEKNFVLRGGVMVMKDGTLVPPFNKAQRWNPQEALPQYAVAERTGNETVRKILESFYLALRMAQPLVIPPDMKGPWPRFISLSFRFQDLPKYQDR